MVAKGAVREERYTTTLFVGRQRRALPWPMTGAEYTWWGVALVLGICAGGVVGFLVAEWMFPEPTLWRLAVILVVIACVPLGWQWVVRANIPGDVDRRRAHVVEHGALMDPGRPR